MSKNNNNSAGGKDKCASGTSVLDKTPPPEIFQRGLTLRRTPSVVLLCLLTVVLLGISFPPFDSWTIAYFALVPWALAISGCAKPRRAILLGWLTGLVFWAMSLYWLTLPTIPGYVASVIYLSMYWLVATLFVRAAMKRNWPMWLVLPIFWTALEYAQSYGLGGFSWFYLSQTQYQQTSLIQIADVTGQYGVTFFVAMVNGFIIDLFSFPLFVPRRAGGGRLSRHVLAGLFACLIVGFGFWSYGQWRIGQGKNTISPGPVIGIVQEDVPITLSGREDTARQILEYHLQRSLEFMGKKCDILLWPETMLPQGMNSQMLNADTSKLIDDEILSISAYVYGLEATKEYPVTQLRDSLANIIGNYPLAAYQRPAAMFLLHEFVKPAQLAGLEEEKVRTLGKIVFGPSAAKFSTAEIQTGLGMFLSESGSAEQEKSLLQRVGQLFLEDEPQQIEKLSKEAILQNIQLAVARRLAGSKDPLNTLRGQAGMISVCSVLTGSPILAGGTSIRPNPRRALGTRDLWVMQNSVMWYDATGPADIEYGKTHLVPFSEYVPFKYSWQGLHESLRWFVPEAMPQLAPGENFERFQVTDGQESWQLVTPVCFEGTVARLCRAMVNSGPKNRMVMANLSNDGWFVYRFGEGPYKGTTEQQQHLVHYVFRAIENRIPVVRSVNTGISGYINSNGEIESLLELQMEEYRKRTMIAGTLKVKTSVDSRVSPYSKIGDTFAMTLSILAVFMAGWLLIKRIPEKIPAGRAVKKT